MRVFIYLFLCFISVECVKKLPPYVEQCYRNPSTELSQCLVRNMNSIRGKSLNGIPELSVPNLNPFIIETAVIKPNADFSCELKDLKLWNINGLNINKFEMTLGKVNKWILDADYPYLFMKFDYNMKGKLLVLQLDSRGPGYGNITGVNCKVETDLETVVKNGKEYLHVKDMNVKMTTDSGHFNFDNLFKDNKELNDRANKIINDNYKVFYEDFQPLVENIMKSTVSHIFNNFYSKFPYDVLFPEKV